MIGESPRVGRVTFSFLAGLALALSSVANAGSSHVNPFIGTDGVGHSFPAATCPFGLVQAGPDTGWGTWAYCSGYQYADRRIAMFSQTHNSGGGCPDYGDLGIMPFVGSKEDVSSTYDKTIESAHPGYYTVTLDRGGIRVEASATEHVALYRIDYGTNRTGRLLVDLDYGMGNPKEAGWGIKTVTPFDVSWRNGNELRGHVLRDGFIPSRHIGFDFRFDPAPKAIEEWPHHAEGVHAPRYVLDFNLSDRKPVCIRIGISTVDGDGASRNVDAEAPEGDFAAARIRTEMKWRTLLSRVRVEGADGDSLTKFYTALYRLFPQPANITDADGRYRGGDGRVAKSEHGPYYSTFALWDTFRAAHPLYTLLAPEKVPHFVNSLVVHQRAVGYLPVLPKWGKDTQCMIATHAVSVIVEAYRKGLREGVDWESAYAAIRSTLRERHPERLKEDWDVLDRYGYYPFDKVNGEAVSRTLECSYDDWCAFRLAEALGKKEDAAFFLRRSMSWTNVLDRAQGFVRGRDSNGGWRDPFDPFKFGHGTGDHGDFTEGNAWQWTWHVLQDPEALVAALGGRARCAGLLDGLFRAPEDRSKAPPDVTGLIGQYVQGNEPSHHIPYLYRYTERPWRTDERIREICERFYTSSPDGICGNEDHGQMSAWYVFACLGFYPVNPASGEYVLGAPQVQRATLNLANGKTFTITARNLSKKNKYVKSVALNGRPITDWKIRHADIMAGGELVFEICANPAGD